MTTTPPQPEQSPPPEELPPTPTAESDGKEATAEWWDDPSLPWRRKPTRSDYLCLGWLTAAGIYGVVISILRPGLLASAPHVLASLGSWTGSILIGARAAVGDGWWPLIWLLGTLGLVKFNWLYWWAGKLWGRGLIEMWSGRSERARRLNERAERFARRYAIWAVVVAMLPLPLALLPVVLAVLGEAGISLRKVMAASIASSFVMMGVYLGIGYWIGEPAVDLVATYGRYLWYVTLALLVVIIGNAWWKSRKEKPAQ
ncbi:MAG: DedA family protein [Propionicimonas sp.]